MVCLCMCRQGLDAIHSTTDRPSLLLASGSSWEGACLQHRHGRQCCRGRTDLAATANTAAASSGTAASIASSRDSEGRLHLATVVASLYHAAVAAPGFALSEAAWQAVWDLLATQGDLALHHPAEHLFCTLHQRLSVQIVFQELTHISLPFKARVY